MAESDVIQRLETQASTAENLISVLKKEIAELSSTISAIQIERILETLRGENKNLEEDVLKAKKELARIQKKNGVEQVYLPRSNDNIAASAVKKVKRDAKQKDSEEKEKDTTSSSSTTTSTISTTTTTTTGSSSSSSVELSGNSSDKSEYGQTSESKKLPDMGRFDLRVGKIIEIRDHPNAENLYIEMIDVGEPDCRQIVSGLRKYYDKEELLNRPVVCLCNLKPVKIRGIESFGMVMCAVKDGDVEPLWPALDSVPGEPLISPVTRYHPDKVLDTKSEVFKTALGELWLNERKFLFIKPNNVPVVVKDKGPVFTKKLSSCYVA